MGTGGGGSASGSALTIWEPWPVGASSRPKRQAWPHSVRSVWPRHRPTWRLFETAARAGSPDLADHRRRQALRLHGANVTKGSRPSLPACVRPSQRRAGLSGDRRRILPLRSRNPRGLPRGACTRLRGRRVPAGGSLRAVRAQDQRSSLQRLRRRSSSGPKALDDCAGMSDVVGRGPWRRRGSCIVCEPCTGQPDGGGRRLALVRHG